MRDYKSEVFLIKGRYYTFTQNHLMFPLIRYGAVEGGLSIDDGYSASASDRNCSDVLIYRHGPKWGLFPALEIIGQCADWASENDNPFIYDSFRILYSENSDPYIDSFILLKKDGIWRAVSIVYGQDTEIELPLEPGLESDTDDILLHALEERYGIKLIHRVPAREIDEPGSKNQDERREFDFDKDFIGSLGLGWSKFDVLKLILGFDDYDLSLPYLYAAAHKNAYAAILIGKSLFKDVPEQTDTCSINDFHDTVLDCSLNYFKLAKGYADEAEDKTASDIASAFIEEAEYVQEKRRPKPVSQFPIKPGKKLSGGLGGPAPTRLKLPKSKEQ